jgi:hypothetical protein
VSEVPPIALTLLAALLVKKTFDVTPSTATPPPPIDRKAGHVGAVDRRPVHILKQQTSDVQLVVVRRAKS